MFHQTRLKLTAWYLVIIMAISIFFSVFIYIGATEEFDRALRIQEYRLEYPQPSIRIVPRNFWENETIPNVFQPDPQVIAGVKLRVLEALIGINVIIFILSALAGYFLAGRTLRPIKEMLDEQNRFITDASHELNTPLTSLRTSIEVNLRNKNLNLSKAKSVLVSNLDDIVSLQSLSDELINLTQYQKANGNMDFEKLSVSEIVKNAIDKVETLAKTKKITVNANIPKLNIEGDKRSLTELFVILIDNAIKYTNGEKPVLVKARKIDSKVEIIVEDKGIGIDKNDLPFIFDRFFRADKSRTKQKTLGYGLGLSIAKRIVVLHKGSIDVESKLNKGTIFTIIFPAA